MHSEFEGKQKKAYIPPSVKKITLAEARQLIVDHVHCTDQEAMKLLEMLQERTRFLETDSDKSA
jgi:hypothetical protein